MMRMDVRPLVDELANVFEMCNLMESDAHGKLRSAEHLQTIGAGTTPPRNGDPSPAELLPSTHRSLALRERSLPLEP